MGELVGGKVKNVQDIARCSDVIYVTYVTCDEELNMSIGPSGRVVVEIDQDLKRRLYSVLAIEGITLKEWFTSKAEALVSENSNATLRKEVPDDNSLK